VMFSCAECSWKGWRLSGRVVHGARSTLIAGDKGVQKLGRWRIVAGRTLCRNNITQTDEMAQHGCHDGTAACNGRTMPPLLLERRHVDHEAVFDVAPQHPLVGLVDLLDGDQLDVG